MADQAQGAGPALPAPRPPTPLGTGVRPSTAGPDGRSTSVPNGRPTSAGGLKHSMVVKEFPKIFSRKHCYAVGQEEGFFAKPTPQSPAELARIDRARDKAALLRAPHLSVWREEDGKDVAKGLPPPFVPRKVPYWSPSVHGQVILNVPEAHRMHLNPTGASLVWSEVRKLAKGQAELALATKLMADAPETKGTEGYAAAMQDERRLRSALKAEVATVEACMLAHLRRLANRRNQFCQAPACSPKDLLMRAFRAADAGRAALAADRAAYARKVEGAVMANKQRKLEGKPLKELPTRKAWDKGKAATDALRVAAIPEKLLTGDVTVAEFCDVWNYYLQLKKPRLEMDKSGHEVEVLALDANGQPRVDHNGRTVVELQELKLTKDMAAALFLKYGFDRQGLMPYGVFANALTTGPARLLGMRDIMDQKSRDRHGFDKGDSPFFDGQIIYAKQRGSVFAPSEFDDEAVKRSSKAPTAALRLQHVYGYAGAQGLANNLFFVDNADKEHVNDDVEMVYYTASVCIVYNRRLHQQRFFFGHNNDVRSLAQNPRLPYVFASGQNKALGGDDEVPYACVWDSRTMCQLQKLQHPAGSRAVVALGFSPDGRTLVTVCSDNPHTLYTWAWMTDGDRWATIKGKVDCSALWYGPEKSVRVNKKTGKPKTYYRIQERYADNKLRLGETQFKWPERVEGHGYGPDRRVDDLKASPTGFFYTCDKIPMFEPNGDRRKNDKGEEQHTYRAFSPEQGINMTDVEKAAIQVTRTGALKKPIGDPNAPTEIEPDEPPKRYDGIFRKKGDDFELTSEPQSANNGSPPQVYEIVWNPYHYVTDPAPAGVAAAGAAKPAAKRTYVEFVTYGVKHVKFWTMVTLGANAGQFVPENGIFRPDYVQNVVSAVFVRDDAAKYRSPYDARKPTGFQNFEQHPEEAGNPSTMLVTGFPSGDIGLWSRMTLVKMVAAHDTGPQLTMPDGTLAYGGVRTLKLLADGRTLMSGGADGTVITWNVAQDVAEQKARAAELKYAGPVPLELLMTITKVCGCKGLCPKPEEEAKLEPGARQRPCAGRVVLRSPYPDEEPPAFRGLDATKPCGKCAGCREGKLHNCDALVLALGTDNCEVWAVDGAPAARALTCVIDGHTADVLSVATHPDPNKADIFVTVADGPRVYVWNRATRLMIRTCNVAFKCSTVCFSADGSHLAVGSSTGRMKVLDSSTLQPLENIKDCTMGISCMKYAPNNRHLAVGSHDLDVFVYDTGFRETVADGYYSGNARFPGKWDAAKKSWSGINRKWDGNAGYKLLFKMEGHSATIGWLDFSEPLEGPPHLRDHIVLTSTCRGKEMLHWDLGTASKPGSGKQIVDNMRDVKYTTRNGVLGFDLMGIWPDSMDFYQLNSLDRSRTREYVVTGDHLSSVKLMNYPCVWNDAPYRQYAGHASFVTEVRFTNDDRHVITVGGGDRCAFQFITHGINKEDAADRPGYTRKDVHWCDVDRCVWCHRKREPKAAPPSWGPLDVDAKAWGSVQVIGGRCQCLNPAKHREAAIANRADPNKACPGTGTTGPLPEKAPPA